jgi:hypothetical protein
METLTIDKQAIIEQLNENICEVTFTKVNGDLRVMQCTLNSSIIPASDTSENTSKRTKKENPDVLAVYDTMARGWRSFRWDSVKEFRSSIAG